MDIKSLVFWGIVGTAAGGGLYGAYMKFFGKAAFTSVEAMQLLNDCTILRTDTFLNYEKARPVLEKVEEEIPNIEKSDSVIAITAMFAGDKSLPSGFAASLRECVLDLQEKIKSTEESQ
ncbi:hypothetical protein ACP3TY_06060 [Pseudomonas rustica]|uniref:hypothetical protein n=1 Tax=Pseudomonas rustica TaxID=2827099 RepID=UPI003CEA2BA2